MRIPTLIISIVAAGSAAVAVVPALADHGAAPTAVAAKTSTVKFGEYFYSPKRLSVRVGDSVRFVNAGKIEHTVADSSRSGTIRSKLIRPRPLERGKSQTVRFRKRGTVYYLCTFHPDLMRGRVVVR